MEANGHQRQGQGASDAASDLLTLPKLARELGAPYSALFYLAKLGVLPCDEKIGAVRLFRRSSLPKIQRIVGRLRI